MTDETPQLRSTRVFLHEIVMFGRISALAVTQLQTALAAPCTLVPEDSNQAQQTSIAAAIQQILYASAMVSKFLWPISQRPFPVARGGALRNLLGINGNGRDHPLNSREVRDSIEHYDERLDAFVAKDYNTFVLSGWTIGTAAMIEMFGTDNSSPLIRIIDKDNLVIRHLGRDQAVREYTGGQASVIDLRAQDAALQDISHIAARVLNERP